MDAKLSSNDERAIGEIQGGEIVHIVNAHHDARITRADIVGLYQRTREHSDRTIEALSLGSVGTVPWWPEGRRQVTLHQILVHITTETHRHAGHCDIIRELIDGSVGLRADATNVPEEDADWWSEYRATVEASALEASE